MATIFISYAHADEEFKEEIESCVKMLALNRPDLGSEVWSDEELLGGDDWRAEIEAIMERAEIALLVVTDGFLKSEFVREHELPYLEERARTHGLRVFPIIADVCPWEDVAWLRRLEHRPKGKHALSELTSSDRKRGLKKLYFELAELAKVPGRTPLAPPPPEFSASGTSQDASSTVELGFSHYKRDRYRVELRYTNRTTPKTDRTLHYEAELHLEALAALSIDSGSYAAELDRRVLPQGAPRELFEAARKAAVGRVLRIRVAIDPTACDLHEVCWETLLDAYAPQSAQEPTILFSRYVSAERLAWPDPVICSLRESRLAFLDLRPRGGDGLDDFESAFQKVGFSCDYPEPHSDPVALEQMQAPVVFASLELTRPSGSASASIRTKDQNVSGEEMAAALRRHGRHVQVLILDADEPEALVSIASDLIASGVCAVVTRQAGLDRSQWIAFLSGFLADLGKTFNINTATHEGRKQIAPRSESWKPLVLTRLRTGKIWFTPCFVGDERGADRWGLVVKRAKRGKIIPILGPGVSQYLLRSNAEIAERLAEQFHFPLAGYETTDLKKVAQYVATMNERDQVVEQFVETVRAYTLERYGGATEAHPEAEILDTLEGLWHDVIAKLPNDPYSLLAELRAPFYLTTAFHNFLSLAVRDRLKDLPSSGEPRDRILTLDKGILNSESDADDTSFVLSRDEPLIYHLFGRIDHEQTLVLTGDDHFRFLLNFKEQWRSLPEKIIEGFSESALLFLGFDLDSSDFRAVFRGILELEGSNQMRPIPHVAVQISPDDDRLRDPEKTRAYLLEYFRQISEKPLIFMGSAQDFLGELRERLR